MNLYVDSILEKVKIVRDTLLSADECQLMEYEIANRSEWEEWCTFLKKQMEYVNILNEIGYNAPEHKFVYEAYCELCGKNMKMIYRGKSQEEICNWPGHLGEDMSCRGCRCNGRLRYMLKKLRNEYSVGMKTYLYERKTNAYTQVSSYILSEDLLGSEYLGSEYKSGEYIDGILHEDAMKLSFADDSFDLMLSMEVFEHVLDYKAAFKEAYRVLKPGGKLLLTIPIYTDLDETYVRAEIVDGSLVHYHEPKYHGDPINPEEGILEITSYGWDIVDYIKSLGFKSVKQIAYFSINEAYFGRYYYFELVK